MKLGKEFAVQMVQEWQEAYMDYSCLKTILKGVLRFRLRNSQAQSPTKVAATTSQGTLKRRVSLYRAFSCLTSQVRGFPRKNEDEVILVGAVQDGGEGQYRTMFLNASEEGGEVEHVFFRKLDDEFNKVINFYRKKVEEVLAEAEDLSRQMDALIALRIRVEKPVVGGGAAVNNVPLVFSLQFRLLLFIQPMEESQDVEMTSEANPGDGRREGSSNGFKPAPLEVLDRIMVNIEPETPVSTMKNIISSLKSDLSSSKEELRKAEELMTRVFVEFYQKLRLLKSYWQWSLLLFH